MVHGHVGMDIAGWLGAFHRDVQAVLSDMFQLCSSAQNNRYSDESVYTAGLVRVVMDDLEKLGETAPQRAARNAFLAGMSKFSGLIDRLIATQRIMSIGTIPVTRDLKGEAEVLSYVEDYTNQVVAEVARDKRLNVPQKLNCFPGVDADIRTMALEYNSLRNALEHHHELPKEDLCVRVRRILPTVNDQEITALPTVVLEGETLGISVVTEQKVYPTGQRVILEPQDTYDLLFTLVHVIALAIFQWHCGPGRPTPSISNV